MIYFISGHRDITQEQFDRYYIPAIHKVIINDFNCEFVVGDCDGADKMAMNYLSQRDQRFTIYHIGAIPRILPEPFKPALIKFKGEFTTDISRDTAMTLASDFDIAYVFNKRWTSGTAQNIKRRHKI